MLKPNPDERYFYLRDEDQTPVGVMAMRIDPEAMTLRVAASICNPSDRWVRAQGVDRALGRLRAKAHPAVLDGVRVGFADEWHSMGGKRLWVEFELNNPLRPGPASVVDNILRLLGLPTRRVHGPGSVTFRHVRDRLAMAVGLALPMARRLEAAG
jgi:hypothetical protein